MHSLHREVCLGEEWEWKKTMKIHMHHQDHERKKITPFNSVCLI